jgi:hypothetical protein
MGDARLMGSKEDTEVPDTSSASSASARISLKTSSNIVLQFELNPLLSGIDKKRSALIAAAKDASLDQNVSKGGVC